MAVLLAGVTAAMVSPGQIGEMWHRIDAHQTLRYEIIVGKGPVEIEIAGAGRSDLDLFVYAGSTLFRSQGDDDNERVAITELTRPGKMEIIILNVGNRPDRFRLAVTGPK